MKYLFFILLFIFGCAPDVLLRIDGGFSPTDTISEGIATEWDLGYKVDVVRLTPDILLSWPFFDIGGGPTFTAPFDHVSGEGYGVEAIARLRLPLGCVEPYLMATDGFEYYTEKWGIQGTNWGFTTQAGVGVRFKTSPGQWLSFDYVMFHESNGSEFFGSALPNPGYNGDMLYIGYEWKL